MRSTTLLNDYPSPCWASIRTTAASSSATTYTYCQRKGITFTCSRPYKKNDSAHLEQKNR